MPGSLRKSGIPPLGEIPWGTHFCHFFETTEDLLEVVVPFFAAGLEQKELCFWLVDPPLTEESARDALRNAVPEFDRYAATGAARLQSAPEWYLRADPIDVPELTRAWMELIDESQKRGFAGLRASAAVSWLKHAQWDDFQRYEREIDEAVRGKPMIVLCSYPLSTTDAAGILDVAESHQVAIAKRDGKWDVVETPARRLRQRDHRNRQQAALVALGLTAIRDRNLGVLMNEAASLSAANEDDDAFLQSVGNVLALAVERNAHEEAERREKELAESALARLHAIESITDSALGRMALDELLAELVARLRRALGVDHTGVLLLNETQTALTIRAIDGVALSTAVGMRVPLDSPIAGRILKEGRPLILHDVTSVDVPEWRSLLARIGARPSSAMGVPFIVEGRTTGVVVVASATRRQFTDDDLDLLRMVADRAAPAIERSRLMESVRAARERLGSLSRRLLTVQEEERRRVAIELHDELGQVLTAVKIGLESMPAQLSESIDSVDRAMRTVRDLALELRPAMLDDLGLASALRWYADRFAQQTHVEMHIAIDEMPDLDAGLATTCFRVAQEALTNVARHASAKNVWLDLHRSPAQLELAIRDDGTGFDVDAARERAARGESLGLVGMEERVSLSGGSIVISSTPGAGTEVRVRFPAGGGP